MLTNSQRCATVDIDTNLILDATQDGIRTSVINHIDLIANYTGTDIFLLTPRTVSAEAAGASFGGTADSGFDPRFRAAIYGDMESVEHAKTRILIMIDQIVRSHQLSPSYDC